MLVRMVHVREGVRYVPVWQTWTTVRAPTTSAPVDESASTGQMSSKQHIAQLRERMPDARICRRLSIEELSHASECDAETLAAFERGEEVLSDSHQRAIRRLLNLT